MDEKTHVEKTRSDILNKKQGSSRPIATKVKVLNKIVREASGVYNYTLVPPPKKDGEDAKEIWDADTHPLTKPYRDASQANPTMCSFGHRPSSASRTFHPATMVFRLKKGEVAKPVDTGRFGLTPANLAKVITAPKYTSLADSWNNSPDKDDTIVTEGGSTLEDPYGLFFSESEQRTMTSKSDPQKNHSTRGDSMSDTRSLDRTVSDINSKSPNQTRSSHKSQKLNTSLPSLNEQLEKQQITNFERYQPSVCENK